MRKLILCIALFTFTLASTTNAQTGVKFGFKAGYNIATQYGIRPPNIPYDVDSDPRHGFTGGILLYFPISEAFGVQQEFIYSNKGSVQNITMTDPAISTSTEYNINYFELPITFHYTFANIGNVGIYGSTGFALSMLLNGDYKVKGEVDLGQMSVPFEESGSTDGLDEFDYSFIYGLGAKFKAFNKDCFFEYRQTIGWNSLLMPTAEGEEPAPLRNQNYAISLGMYF